MRGTKGMAIAVALGAAAVLGACSKGDKNAADTTAMAAAPAAGDSSMRAGAMNAGTGSSTSMNNGNTATPASSQPMTDAQIMAMTAAANEGEIAAGKMAETKATNPAVKAFARAMVTDHSMMLTKGQALAKKLNITPSAAAADSMSKSNQAMANTLTNTPKGMAFDSAYVNAQVMGHQQVLDMVKSAEGQAQNPQVKAMLSSAQPAVQRHLDRIKDIQGKMK